MSIFTFIEGGYKNQFREALLIEMAYFPIRLLVVYFNYFLLLPKLLMQEKTKKYILYTFLSLTVAVLIHRLLMFHYINELIFPNWDQGSFWQLYKFIQTGMIITSPMIFIVGITVVYRLVASQRKITEIEKEKTKTELQYLRNQINPHFFFNTLNNLYGLALVKSDKTADLVMKLSELMSYMLYDSQQPFVPLSKEISYIKNYIELEKIRFDERFICEFDIINDVEIEIPPMLLLPFVENAFKHGVHSSSSNAWIRVGLLVEKQHLKFEVENSVELEKDTDKGGGLGISNIKRRLELLYTDKHDLRIHRSSNSFQIVLNIELE